MDPITHALVGAGVAGLSGGEVSVSNPIYIGAVLGAMAPDLDIVYQLRGDVHYLKHHRGFSHSIPGLALISAAIAGGLSMFFPEYGLMQLFFWTMLGAMSHTLMDILNSYGAQILGPFSKKRYSLNLVTIPDPIMFAIFTLILLVPGPMQIKSAAGFGALALYLGWRLMLRYRVKRLLEKRFANSNISRIAVMPSMLSFMTWDFLLETDKKCFVGQASSLGLKLKVRRKLIKPKQDLILEHALKSKLGKFFDEFTPYYYVDVKLNGDKYIINFFDLRYYLKKDFLHTATMAFDKKYEQIEAIFAPYNGARKINITG
ncbi:inner membrane protein [Desulfitispora alkaliphila]|uniref:metal-dependent hydrolase n=1 Tax=Desulfitispora alkaliphila TaxID=622674 RepID=UPI003D1CF7D8